jgi:23S rRNA (cytidine1920-2'-O)/16S rRNA (cytidine1409-2'-O)-methyltransferase
MGSGGSMEDRGRERLDVLLVERGLVATREKARRVIMAGEVIVDGIRETKPGTFVKSASEIELRSLKGKRVFVSRGGEKLAKALLEFEIDARDKVVMDIGASTGGFTDCLLQHGARRVYAIDVGYGQLAWELRNNPNVVVMERTNVRYLEPGSIPELCDFATVDVSFISVVKFIRHLLTFLKDDGGLVILIKPQFEAGREEVRRGGVVRDPDVHVETIRSLVEFMEGEGLDVKGLTYSPITGPAGNIEFLVYAIKRGAPTLDPYPREIISQVVEAAHSEFVNG